MNALQAKQLRKIYEKDDVEALRGIDLTIPKGSFYGLLGPNGAGKSTLIHCATGIALPTGGNIKIFGKDAVSDYRQARSYIGFSPQEINLDWFLTVEGTLEYHGRYFGVDRNARRKQTNELLKAFSLEDKRRTKTNLLSGGMKRRLLIARALMHKPKLLILDEPTAGVDVELRHELWNYTRRINRTGTTILLTTHYIEEAERLCDRISLIAGGKIVKTGTVDALKKSYKKRTLEDVYLAATGKQADHIVETEA